MQMLFGSPPSANLKFDTVVSKIISPGRRNAMQKSDETIAERVMQVITDKFAGSFTVKNLRYWYTVKYGEISSRRIFLVIDQLEADGILRRSETHVNKVRFMRPPAPEKEPALPATE